MYRWWRIQTCCPTYMYIYIYIYVYVYVYMYIYIYIYILYRHVPKKCKSKSIILGGAQHCVWSSGGVSALDVNTTMLHNCALPMATWVLHSTTCPAITPLAHPCAHIKINSQNENSPARRVHGPQSRRVLYSWASWPTQRQTMRPCPPYLNAQRHPQRAVSSNNQPHPQRKQKQVLLWGMQAIWNRQYP